MGSSEKKRGGHQTLTRDLSKRAWLAPFLTAFFLYGILAAGVIRKPMSGDEVYCLEEARAYARWTPQKIVILGQDITFTHVPLYPLASALLIRLFGENLFLLRSIGIGALTAVLFLLSYFPFRFLPDSAWAKRVSWIAPIVVASHPISVQGSAILDYESTFFLLFLCLFSFVWLTHSFSKASFWILSSLYALALWGRTTTACLIPVSWMFWAVFTRPSKKEWRYLLGILAVGLLLFGISFGIFVFFAWGIQNFFEPFRYLYSRVATASHSSSFSPSGQLQDLSRLLFWFGIPWLLLFFAGLVKKVPERLSPFADRIRFLKVLVWVGIPFYYFITKLSWGYPKYLLPFIPIATFLFVMLFSEEWPLLKGKEASFFLILTGALVVLSFFLLGDPLYQLSYELKKKLLSGAHFSQLLPMFFRMFGLPSLFLFSALFVTRFLSRKKKERYPWALGGFIALFAGQLPFVLTQSYASYPTTAFYGDTRRGEVVAILKHEVRPTESIFSPELIIPYEAGNQAAPYWASYWNDPKTFLEQLKEQSPKAVVYSISMLNLAAYRTVIQNREVQKQLRQKYVPRSIGDYTLWLKK